MALSMLVALVAAPALLGTQEAIRQSQGKEKREEHRARRCNLVASCVKPSLRRHEIDGRNIVLRKGKLYIDTETEDDSPFGHPFAGYYLPYPDTKYEGLVTTITNVARFLNWVYIDKDTYEIKYGVRADAQPNFTGPFDCTRQDRRMIFDGWEGFCAVEEQPSIWALYFDKDDDGLRSKVAPGTRVLDIELTRKEKRWAKEILVRHQDQTIQRSVDTKEETPVDDPVTSQAQNDPSGTPEAEQVRPTPFAFPKSLFTGNPLSDSSGNIGSDDNATLPFPVPTSIFDKEATTLDSAQSSDTGLDPKPFALPKSIFADEAPPPYFPTELVVQSKPELEPNSQDGESPTSQYSPVDDNQPPSLKPYDAVTTQDMLHLPTSPPKITMQPSVQTLQGISLSPSTKTGQLSRNRESRTLAKAQMFEALSQKLNDSPPRKEKPISRPPSNRDGSPNSSERSSTDILLSYYGRPDSSVLTASAPTTQQSQSLPDLRKDEPKEPSTLSDPAVFSASVDKAGLRVQFKERSETIDKSTGQTPNQRKDSLAKIPNREPPKTSLPFLPRQPRMSRTGTKENARTTTVPLSLQRETSSREIPKAETVEKRKPTVPNGLSRTMSRSTANTPSTRSDALTPRQRNDSEASNPPSRVTGRPRAGTDTSTSRQFTATTTTKTDRASAVRNGGPRRASPDLDVAVSSGGSRTSTLYRELDDILKPNPMQRSRETPIRSGSRREDRPPLRKAYTAKSAPRPRSPT